MAALKDRLKAIQNLPALPDTAVRLVQALNGDSMGMAEVEKIVRLDEAITLAVVRLANSAALGGGASGRAFTLGESLSRVGARELQRLALSLSAGKVLDEGGKGYGLMRGALWQGALGGGLGAELIAQTTGLEDPGTCFVAGMLRDIGKLAMDHVVTVDRMESELVKDHPDEDQVSLERRVFGLDHAELGAELSEMWGLPERLAGVVRYHHAPPADGEPGHDVLVDIVHCADALTCWLAIGVGFDGLAYHLDERAAHNISFDRAAIEKYLPELRKRFDVSLEQMNPNEV